MNIHPIFKKLPRLFNKKTFETLLIFVVFIGVVLELQAAVIIEILNSFGKMDSGAFIQFRLKFSAMVILLFLLYVALNARTILTNRLILLYGAMLSIMALIIYLNREMYAFTDPLTEQSTSAIEFWGPILFKYLVFFILGLFLWKTNLFRHLYLLLTIVLSFVVLTHVDFDVLGINRRNYVASANTGNYLFLGDATAISFLILMAFYNNTLLRILLIAASTIIIFLIGSRTSFILYLGTVILFIFWNFNFKVVPYVLILFVALGFGANFVDFTELSDKNGRMTNIFTDYQDDNSVIARANLSTFGWEDIKGNIFLGNFGGQHEFGSGRSYWQSYMHSVASYWRQFGIVIMAAILFFAFRFSALLLTLIKYKHSVFYRTTMLLGTFIFVEAALSRSLAFSMAHLFFGLVIALDIRSMQHQSTKLSKSNPSVNNKDSEPPKRRKKRRTRKGFSF